MNPIGSSHGFRGRRSSGAYILFTIAVICLIQMGFLSQNYRHLEVPKILLDEVESTRAALVEIKRTTTHTAALVSELQQENIRAESRLLIDQFDGSKNNQIHTVHDPVARHINSVDQTSELQTTTSGPVVPEKYIYVYDFGDLTKNLTDDLANAPIRWWSRQYEGEYELFNLLNKEKYGRTYNPDEAVLFYLPFFSARYTLVNFLSEDKYMMKETIEKTSHVWESLINKVKIEYPYFNRSNGRNHFSVLTMDHGRCSGIAFCNPSVYGEMFFIQLNADKMVRSNHATTSRHMQALTYNYGAHPDPDLPDIPCYMSDRDIVVPPISSVTHITKPLSTERNIIALFRFSSGQHHGVPIPHFNHLIRKELLEMYKNKGIPGWDFDEKSEWETREDWKHAKFCISPPGHSQWTSRPTKSIISGCIPVTFYRDHDNPWQDELDWEMFSINVDPDNLESLHDRINEVINTPNKLEQMQKELERVQEYFLWGQGNNNGALMHLMKALHKRASKLAKVTPTMADL